MQHIGRVYTDDIGSTDACCVAHETTSKLIKVSYQNGKKNDKDREAGAVLKEISDRKLSDQFEEVGLTVDEKEIAEMQKDLKKKKNKAKTSLEENFTFEPSNFVR